MAKLPPIDLSDFLKLLKNEGRSELNIACSSKFGQYKILYEWDNIIRGLEEIIPKLAEGAEISSIKAPIMGLAKSAGALASMASQFLSFVPGPVGMICSAINAIVCFCTLPFPVNIGNGMLELLGCIPGGKVAGKLAPRVEKILLKVIENSPELRKAIETGEKINSFVKKFSEQAAKKLQCSKNISNTKIIKPAGQKTLGGKLDIDEVNFYSGQTNHSILHEGNQIVRRYQVQPRPITNTGNPYANIYSHLWKGSL